MRRATLKTAAVFAGLASMAACSGSLSDPLAVDVIHVSVVPEPESEIVVSPSDPEWFRVTAVNRGTRRVVWGTGSSSCQLGLAVRAGLVAWQAIDRRDCTADLVEQGLDPGETVSEVLIWGGEVSSGTAAMVLEPGQYSVVGVVGDEGRSSALRVRVAP